MSRQLTRPRPPARGPRRASTARRGVLVVLGAAALPLLAAPAAQADGATSTEAEEAGEAGATTRTVRPGDTLWAIAAATGTSVADLAAANGVRDPRRLQVGRVLTVPAPGTPSAAPSAASPAASPPASAPAVREVVVVRGDTLSQIAARAGVPLDAVLGANGLQRSSVIRPGQVVRVPGGVEPVESSFAGRTYPASTTAAATAHRGALAARALPTRAQVRQIVADTARAHGVDPSLALAVAHQESGFDPRAVSPADAVGAMQVIPRTGRWASAVAGRPLDLLDPHDNATAGVLLLRQLTASEPDEPTAIAGYYQGLANVRAHGPSPDTQRYVANVQALRERFR